MSTAAAGSAVRLPRQIPYIIGNEACERFSFYGMRNILMPFLVSSVAAVRAGSRSRGPGQGRLPQLRHRRVLLPAAGRVAVGPVLRQVQHRALVLADLLRGPRAAWRCSRTTGNGFYTGLFLIALGSGGIKPLVVSFVGDQFDQSQQGAWPRSSSTRSTGRSTSARFFASLLMPIFLREYGAAVAFGIPGILMFIATLIFWLGRKQYVRVPPTRGQDPDSFFNVAAHGADRPRRGQGRPGLVVAAFGAALAVGDAAVLGAQAGVLAGGFRVRHHRLPGAGRADRLRRHRGRRCSSNAPAGTHPDGRSTSVRRCCAS